jgi:glycosyltransferase involved in cell wall biosynthesis
MTRRLRIVHVCLRSVYTEGMSYQDNLLPDQNVLDGHEVTVIAGCEKYSDGKLVFASPEDRMTASGVRLIRLPMAPLGHPAITARFSRAEGLGALLKDISPDVVLYHGAAGLDLVTAALFKRRNPESRLFVDSHEDRHNSGTNQISLWIQYKIFNNALIRLTKKYTEKYLYISLESRDFLRDHYGLDETSMEFFPLGGVPVTLDVQDRTRLEIREREGLTPETFLVVHSGKLAPGKRTLELARAFAQLSREDACLIIIGSAEDAVLQGLQEIAQRDPRIRHLGWRGSKELMEYITAADLYAQPGTQSATLQSAICCGAPVLTYPHPSYRPFVQGNGFFVDGEEEIGRALERLSNDPALAAEMRERSRTIAHEQLGYKVIAERLYR